MRPQLKKIVEVIKKEGPIQDKKGYWEMLESFSEEKEHTFLKKNMHRLRKPIKVSAGTTWIAKSSSGNTKGMFKEDCRIRGVVNRIGNQIVLDKPASVIMGHEDYPEFYEQLSSLSTDLLEKIAEAL